VTTVRLKPEKVDDLCRQIATALKVDTRVKLLAPAEVIQHELRKVFLEDLEREDELMEEVERIMQANRGKIIGKNIDVQLLRRKIRNQLVRERKIIL
jgi:hypothetical protein